MAPVNSQREVGDETPDKCPLSALSSIEAQQGSGSHTEQGFRLEKTCQMRPVSLSLIALWLAFCIKRKGFSYVQH